MCCYYIYYTGGGSSESRGICDYFLTFISFLIFVCTLPISLCFCIKVGLISLSQFVTQLFYIIFSNNPQPAVNHFPLTL